MCVPCEDNMPAACAAQAPFDYKMTYPSHFIDHPQESCFQQIIDLIIFYNLWSIIYGI